MDFFNWDNSMQLLAYLIPGYKGAWLGLVGIHCKRTSCVMMDTKTGRAGRIRLCKSLVMAQGELVWYKRFISKQVSQF